MDQGADQAPINPMSLLSTDLFWVMEQHLSLALTLGGMELLICCGFSLGLTSIVFVNWQRTIMTCSTHQTVRYWYKKH